MFPQLILQVREFALLREPFGYDPLAQVLREVQEDAPAGMPGRVDMNKRVGAYFLEASLAKQPRKLAPDERIDSVLLGVAHE